MELVASPEHPLAGPRLLARACGEAMERDQNSVCFHAPPDDPLHRLFQQAGGTQVCQEAWQGEVLMARVLEPAKLLRLLCPVLHERARAARSAASLRAGLLGARRQVSADAHAPQREGGRSRGWAAAT